MALTYVTLTADLSDGGGNIITTGTATFVPSAQLTDAGHEIVIEAPVTVAFNAQRSPSVSLLATDNADLMPSGWTWGVTFSGVPGNPAPFSFFLPAAGGASQDLSSLSPVSSGTAFQAYMPLPSGTPQSGQVPAATGAGEASAWTTVGGLGTVTSVAVETANGFTGTVADGTTTPQLTLETTVTGLLKGDGTAVSAASAGTDYLTPSGDGSALTGITASQVGADASGAASAAQSAAESFATSTVGTETTRAEAAEALLAPKASPALTGTPTAPTAPALTGTAQIATTAYADTAVSTETTRAEAAEALLAPKASPALTGTPTAPTAAALTDSTQVATTAYADSAVAAETTRAETAEALALPKAGGTMTGALVPKVVSVTFGTTMNIDASAGNEFKATLTASTGTFANPTGGGDGENIIIRVTQDGTGGRTVAWGTAYDWGSAGSAPALSAAASACDLLGFKYNSDKAKWMYLSAIFPQGF